MRVIPFVIMFLAKASCALMEVTWGKEICGGGWLAEGN